MATAGPIAMFVTISSLAAPGLPLVTPSLMPFLIAIAGILLALLCVRRAPSVAWISAIGASYVASTVSFGRATALDPGRVELWSWVLVVAWASMAAILTMTIAVRYATRPESRIEGLALPVAVAILGWLAVGCATTIIVVLAGQRTPDPAFNLIDIATVPIAFYLPLLLVVTVLGIVADIRAARDRAVTRVMPSPGRGRAHSVWEVAAATLRELIPGQSAAEEASLAAERTRLAGDLHAAVLPGLRRAIADAEAGGDPDVLARRLRAVDLELERLMADRWPVVLEAFGLVAALEDLAERVEADTGLDVEIDVGRAGERPPPAIERTAWRVAQIAVDNAAKHAQASTIRLTVGVDVDRVTLVIADDGRGFDATAPGGIRFGARGLADANRRALAIGAAIRIEARTGGGTTVAFDWVARRP
jgi:signal transduction histidine kinase